MNPRVTMTTPVEIPNVDFVATRDFHLRIPRERFASGPRTTTPLRTSWLAHSERKSAGPTTEVIPRLKIAQRQNRSAAAYDEKRFFGERVVTVPR